MRTTIQKKRKAAEQKRVYHEKVSKGLCTRIGCSNNAEPGKRMCQNHLDALAAYNIAVSRSRAINGLCRRHGCPNAPVDGKTYCQSHLDNLKQQDLAIKAKGQCRRCRRLPPINGQRRCRECAIKEIALRWGTTYEVLTSIWTGVCPYSGRQIEVGVNASLDHKVARANGGTNNKENLQWVHSEVNTAKHSLTEEQFQRLIADCYRNTTRKRRVIRKS